MNKAIKFTGKNRKFFLYLVDLQSKRFLPDENHSEIESFRPFYYISLRQKAGCIASSSSTWSFTNRADVRPFANIQVTFL